MLSPTPRDDDDGIKTGPCGPYVKPAVPPAQNSMQPGQQFLVRWDETINHDGYWWIDLARNDTDLTNFNPNDADPANNNRPNVVWRLSPPAPGNIPDNQNGGIGEFMVTIPADLTCDNCTLRVVQFMEGRAQPYYYTCADVRIQPAGTPPPPGDGSQGDQSSLSEGAGKINKPGFGGCGSIDSGSGGGQPPAALIFLLFFFPLLLAYVGKMSPITLRR